MAKQLNVNLAINANTTQAQAELKKLQQELYNIMNASSGKNLSAGMKEASAAAKELSYHLNQAYNTSTGNLDLSKLNTSLQKSSTNITQLSNKLLQAGTSGQTAFVNLAQAISKADYPMFKLNGRLAEMWTTLKNTARWQLSSSVLHGFMGAVQQATSYAKELDESLNNIRIVTGMSVAEMDVFAEKANKAAKALSTTTTAYTNAALIFYQQGLDAKEVEERTAITVKMAQVAGESATEVSSYMTAIWNNFNSEVENGQRTLESFGDSLARLGADTAASSAEIAAGLEKFAAIGETVGLSFDYASAAVTTIVANTRQSADTVGTALKTIFARLQGLSLGETLEDGTDLNKYSKALEAVGVQVLDLNGELRDANDIIYDLGIRWDGLTRAQQTALAQTVAGTRQYSQLMSLMSDFDGFLTNVKRSQGAEGSLQEQAEIYADAWEAARARVDAAAEGIYDSLINRDLMTNYNNLLADVLTGVENLIDGLGGLGGVISAVGSFALTLISHKIQPAIQGMVLNIRNLFESTQVQAQSLVSTFQGKVNEQINTGNYNKVQEQELRNASLLAEARAKLTVASRNLNEQEKLGYQLDIENIERDTQKAQKIAEVVAKLQEEKDALLNISNVPFNSEALELYNNKLKILMTDLEVLDQLMDDAIMQDDTAGFDAIAAEYDTLKADIYLYIQTQEDLQSALQDSTRILIENYGATQENAEGYNNIANQAIQPFIEVLDSLTSELKENADAFKDGSLAKTNYENRLRLILKSMPQMVTQSKNVKKAFGQMLKAENVEQYESALADLKTALKQTGMTAESINKIFKQIDGQKFEETKTKVQQLKDKEEELRAVQEGLNAAVNNFNPTHMVTGLERITATAAGLGQVAMMASSLRSIFNAWSNDDMTFGEKITSTFMAISMLVPGVIGVFNSLKTVISGTAIETALYTAALKKEGLTEAEISAQRALTLALRKSENAEKITSKIVTDALTGSLKLHKIALTDEELATLKSVIASKLKDGASLKEAISSALVAATSKRVTGAINKETAAKIADKVATDALNVSIKSLLGPIGLVLALVTALISGLSIWAQKAEENAQKQRELRQEASEAAIQEAEALEEERKKNEQLYTEYINLKSKLDDSTESKEALKAKTEELCAALGVEWDALDKIQNKLHDVNKEILETRRSTLISNIGTLQEDIAVAGDYVEDTVDKISESNDKFSENDFGMSTSTRKTGEIKQDEWWNIAEWFDGNDTYQPSETYTRPYLSGGGSTNVGTDNTEIRNLFYDWMYENYSDILEGDPIAEGASTYNNRGQSALYFNEGTQEEDIVAAVKEFSDYLITEKDQLGINTDSAAYEWFKSFNGNAAVEEQVAAIEGMNEELVAAVKELAQVDAELAGLDISDIKTEDAFNAYKEQWMSNFRQTMTDLGIDIGTISDEALGDIAEEYLGQYENISDIIVERDVSKSISEKTGIAQDRVKEIAAEYEDFLTLVPKINFDLIDSEEELRHVLDTLQAEADANELEAKIDIVQKAQDGLKDGMSAQDYADYQTSSGIDWGNEEEEIIQYAQFLSMTYEEQAAYLQGLEDTYNTALETSIETAIAGHTDRLNNELIPAFKAAAEIVSSFEDTVGDMGSVGDFLMGQINQLDPNADNYQDEINRILGTQQGGVARQNFGLTSEQIDSYVRAKQEATALNEEMINVSDTVVELSNQQQVDEILDFKTAKEEAVSLLDTLSNLKIGDTISLEQFQQLSNYMPSLTEHFRQATDGTYQLKSGLDEVNNCFLLLSQITVDGNKLFSGFEISGMITDLEALKEAFKEGAFGLQEFNTRWVELNEVADLEGLDTEELEDYADYLQEIADSSDDLSDALDINDEAAKIVAKSIQKMNRGIDKLVDGFEDWSDVLEKSSEESEEYYEALGNMRDALSDVLDVSGDFISNDFIVEHLEDIEKAATGDADAIDRLKAALADQIILDIVGVDKFEDLPSNLQTAIDKLKDIVANTDIRVGDSINLDMDDSGFLAACQEIISNANMTAEQANAYFDAMGFETQFATEEQPVEQRNPITVTKTEVQGWTSGTSTGPDGQPRDWEYPILATSTYNDGYATETGMVDAIAMTTSTDGSTEVPKIESVTKKSTGKHNNSSGVNDGGNKKTGGKTSKKSVNRYEKEFNEFQQIEDKLDDLGRAYSKAGKLKDQAFGANKLKYIDDEIEALDDLIENQEIYIQNLKDARDKAFTDAETGIAQYGFTRDANGNLTNYEEITRAKHKTYEDAVNDFNNKVIDEEAFEKIEEEYNKFKELLQIYMGYNSQWEDEQEKLLDYQIDKISKELEKITTEVDSEIEINQRDLDKLDYVVDKLGRNLNTMIEQIDKLGSKVGAYQNQSTSYTKGINDIIANAKEENRLLTDDEQRQIWEYQDSLLDINKSLMDLVETIENSIMEEFERLSDEIDENIGRFDTYSETLDHFQNILKLSGRTVKDSALILDLAAQKTDIAMKKLNATNDKYKAQQKSLSNIEDKLKEAKDSDEIKYWQDQYDKQAKIVEETHNEMLQSWEDVLQAASDQFDLQIETTIQTLKDSISEFGLEGLADRYDKATEAQDRYLSQLDKEYELNKMNRDIQSKIDDTDNIKAKQKLLELQDEINAKLASGAEMSKYDLEHLQKKYDLELAKIALEEAQNAKSTVRLSRDSEGNFGYVYTADEDKVADAEQNYEDKLYELKSHSEEYLDEMSQKIIENQEEMMEALAAVDKTKFATQEEYEAELDRIKEYYMGKDKYYRQEMQKAMDELGVKYQDTILGQIEGSESLDAAQQKLETNTNTATTQMGQAWKDWKDTVDKSATEAGTSSATMTQDITNDAKEISEASETLAGDIDTQTTKMQGYIEGLIQKVHDWRDNYIDDIQDMIDANEELALSNATVTKEDLTTEKQEEKKDVEEDTSIPQPEEKSVAVGSRVTVKSTTTHFSSKSSNKKMQSWVPGTSFEVFQVSGNEVLIGDRNRSGTYTGWVNKTDLEGFFTGGYTGAWGPEGKLAMLHEKELVLNADDTENMLKTITFVRELVGLIDHQASLSSLSSLSAISGLQNMTESLEQSVTIHAEFPNATNHNEIEEAFNNLVNRAAQYANRK